MDDELGIYEVEVCRVAYSYKTIRVMARDYDRAREVAINAVGDADFGSEKSADYEVVRTQKVNA